MAFRVNLLLDTTVLIDALRGRSQAVNLLKKAEMDRHGVYTSAMNVGEVYGGIRVGEGERVERFLADIKCLPITLETARLAGKMQSGWSRRGRTFALADMMVAATALTHGMALVTSNRKDFPMVELTFWPE